MTKRVEVDDFLNNITYDHNLLERLAKKIEPDLMRKIETSDEIEIALDKLSKGEQLSKKDKELLSKWLMGDPDVLEDLLISVFLTFTMFESLLSSKIRRQINYRTLKNRLTKDSNLALKVIQLVEEWAANNPMLGRVLLDEEVRKVIRIQRALRRSSEKLGEVVEDLVREKLEKEGIKVDAPDVTLSDMDEKVDMCCPDRNEPRVLIEVKFHNSHGTKMQRDAEKIEKLADYVVKKKLWLAAVIDGAGWWFRKKDLERILSLQDERVRIFQLATLEDLVRFVKSHV